MGAITETQLKNELKSGNLSRIYFLYGEEDFLVKTYSERIVDAAVAKDMRDMNFAKFTETPRAAVLADYLDEMPVFADYKCALVMNLEFDKIDAAEQKKYAELFKNIPETAVLIIDQRRIDPALYSGKKGKDKHSDKEINAAKKLFETVGKYAQLCEFKYLSMNRVCTQIRRRVERAGCTIADENASVLAEECGMSLTLLGNEIDKLCSYKQSGEITKSDIDMLVPKRADAGIFTLSDALFEGDTQKAFEILDELFAQQFEEHEIFGVLSGYFVNLYRAKLGMAAGKSWSETAQAFGYFGGKSYSLKFAYPKASKLSVRYLGDCLTVMYKTNKLLNSSKMDGRIILESAVAELSMIKRTDD